MSTLSFGPTQKPESCLCFDNKQCCLNRNHCWPFCSRSWRRRMGRRVGRQVHRRLRRGRIGRRQRHAARRRSCVNETQVRFHRVFFWSAAWGLRLGQKSENLTLLFHFDDIRTSFDKDSVSFERHFIGTGLKIYFEGVTYKILPNLSFLIFLHLIDFHTPPPKKQKKNWCLFIGGISVCCLLRVHQMATQALRKVCL